LLCVASEHIPLGSAATKPRIYSIWVRRYGEDMKVSRCPVPSADTTAGIQTRCRSGKNGRDEWVRCARFRSHPRRARPARMRKYFERNVRLSRSSLGAMQLLFGNIRKFAGPATRF
jgi:hypothetical protein